MPIGIVENALWAGSEASLNAALKAEEAIYEKIKAGTWDDDDDEQETPRLLSVENGVATISIKGSLVNSGAWYLKYFGMTGYPEIREALVHAAKDADVKAIALDIDSGGGAVAGLDDTAQLIQLINKNVKPIQAYSSGSAYSAAYWLAASAESFYMGRGAGAGSIGVIAFHMEKSKMYEELGVGVTVVRSGRYKTLANPYETLSEEGKGQLQAHLDNFYELFVTHVSEGRNKSVEYVKTVMAEGREFHGQAAVDAHLSDGIKTFSQFMSDVIEKGVDSSNHRQYTHGTQGKVLHASNGEVKMSTTLTEQEIAALAAGIDLASDGAEETDTTDTTADTSENVEVNADNSEDSVEEIEDDKVVEAANEVQVLLSAQLKESQEALLAARLELSRTQEKLGELQAVVAPLQEIAAKAVNNMRIACRTTALEMSAMTPAQVVAEHQAIVATFTKQFPVGGVASTQVEAADEKKRPLMTAAQRARVKATKI